MKKSTQIIIYILLGVMAAAIIAAGVIMFIGSREHGAELDELDKLNDKLESEGAQLEAAVGALESEKSHLEGEVAALNSRLAALEAQLADANQAASEEAAYLREEIYAKDAEISALVADIAKYRTVFNIDVRAQAQMIDVIDAYIATMCPYVRMVESIDKKTEKITYKWVLVADLIEEERLKAVDAGEDFILSKEELDKLDKDGLKAYNQLLDDTLRPRVLAREDVFYPQVSVYYEDLATGYHYGYNEQITYNSASVIKAPFAMALLELVSKDEEKFYSQIEKTGTAPNMIDTNGDGIGDKIEVVYSDPKYDLSEKVTYNKATMEKPGSGKIRDMADGTEFTWLQFVQYAIEYSDNVAYQALRGRYGFQHVYNLASRVKANSVVKNGNNMTAEDAGKLFKEIWRFIDTDDRYGPILKESMRKASHTVIIQNAVYPTSSLHKYGWDTNSYHDAGIVLYGEKPYVVTVFTDLDKGGNEINAYLQEIVKLVHRLHKGFYS